MPEILAQGRIVYNMECTLCHNVNPRLPGVKGPPVYGVSFAVLKDRMVGRVHLVVPDMPNLEFQLEAVHAYLNDSK